MSTAEDTEQPAWSTLDDESLALIISLMTQDAVETIIRAKRKGKQIEGVVSDAELALQLHTQELDRAAAYVSDRQLARRIQDSAQADSDAVLGPNIPGPGSLTAAFNAVFTSDFPGLFAQDDQQLAIQLSHEHPSERQAIADSTDVESNAPDTPTDQKDYRDGQPESSSTAAARTPEDTPYPEPHWRSCSICRETAHVIDLAWIACGHRYCRQCLQGYFRDSIRFRAPFPPHCCGNVISPKDNRWALGLDLFEQFEKKLLELQTPNKTYCHRPTCSEFIPPGVIRGGIARCTICAAETCEACKKAAHQGDCSPDTEFQQVLEIASDKKWKRCLDCSTMVESMGGCNHMMCMCGAEFCYLCGARWKTCQCARGPLN
ncbi:hypothetical protein GGS21DRAFT_364020 [Xylaria nigripes]|nr:hypothetical protein GGS21DRAFT_364020 [Xylaria nigripes]